jgi:hypothetical protein
MFLQDATQTHVRSLKQPDMPFITILTRDKDNVDIWHGSATADSTKVRGKGSTPNNKEPHKLHSSPNIAIGRAMKSRKMI